MEFLKPSTVEEALASAAGKDAVYLSGGSRGAFVANAGIDTAISIEGLGFEGLQKTDDGWSIGSAAKLQDLIDTPGLPPAVTAAARRTASRTLRGMMSVGGEIATYPAGSCLLAVLAALDARVVFADGSPEVSILDYRSVRNEKKLIRGIRIDARSGYCRFGADSRTSHSRITLVVAVNAIPVAGVIENAVVTASDGVTGIVRLQAVEKAVSVSPLPGKSIIEELVRGAFEPKSDFHASGAYKKYLAGVFIADLLHEIAEIGGVA